MSNTITNRQLFFMLFLTLTCFSVVVISKEMAQSAGAGAWLTIIVTALVFALGTAVIVSLNNMFQGKMLFDYAPSLVTKPVTYLLSIYYVIYFMFILVFLVTGFSKLLNTDFFPKTPLWAFPLVGIPVFCYIAYKGVTNVARLTEIIGAVFLFTALFIHILMLTEGKVNRILPLFNPKEVSRYIEGFKYSIFPFLGVETLLIIPFTKKSGKKAVRTGVLALLAVGLFYVLVIESCIMKLGLHDIINYNDALIVAIRDTAPPFLEIVARLDILYLTVGFGGLFVGISIVMLAIVEYLCRIFKQMSRIAVVIAVGAVAYGLFLLAAGVKGFEKFGETLGTYAGLFSAFAIPITLLIIAKAKKRNAKGDSHAS